MKTAQRFATFLLLFLVVTSCQEEDVISGITFNKPIVFPTPGTGSATDTDGDGVPNDKDDCPTERADEIVDPDRDGCINNTTHSTSTVSSLIRRRPKPCEITGNCNEELSLGDVITSLIKPGDIAQLEVNVYSKYGKWIGSSTKQHGGSVLIKNGTALSDVLLASAHYKKEPLTVVVTFSFAVKGKMRTEEGKFYMKPEDFK